MGYDINYSPFKGNKSLRVQPLYVKYANSKFSALNINLVKADLNNTIPTDENAEIIAYLSWIIRVLNLVAP